MSWTQKLCEVYDTVSGTENSGILPVGFAQKRIKYHVILTPEGEFETAYQLPEQEQLCAVPSTPQAEGRTGSNGTPFPLADSLKYLVGGQADVYLHQLADWCAMPDAPDCLRVLYRYLEKKTLLQDLMNVQGLKLQYHKDKEKQDGAGPDVKSMVCFSVQSASSSEKRLWLRSDVRESWSRRFAALSDEAPALCYATGEHLPVMQNHPKLIGNAKLISAKDAGFPFQYKGRFVEDRSAAEVSVVASTKMHNALRWLLAHQGFQRYGMHLVAWNTEKPALDLDLFDWQKVLYGEEAEETNRQPDTFEAYAIALRNATAGYLEELRKLSSQEGQTETQIRRMQEIVILGLQAATDGRMSIIYYQELPGNLYIQRLQDWAEACLWEMPGKEKRVRTPTWLEICEAVMGPETVKLAKRDAAGKKSDAKQMREMQLRLLSCEVNGSPLPRDFLQQAFQCSVQPLRFTDHKGSWSSFAWSQCMAVTCALLRKVRLYDKQSPPSWVLDRTSSDRSYLYGRLLAVAHKLEKDAVSGKDVPTTAVRVMARYALRPDETWLYLYSRLVPYLKRVGSSGQGKQGGNQARWYQCLFGEIERLFRPEDRIKTGALTEDFLVGFYAQLRELYLKKGEERQVEPDLPPFSLPKHRDALYGCLLAVADHCEWMAESSKHTTQTQKTYRVSRRDGGTNAIQLTSAYITEPSKAWIHVHDKLIPYLEKMGVEAANYFQWRLRQIEQGFSEKDRLSAEPLGSLFLHGYLGMRYALVVKGGLDPETWKEQPSCTVILDSRDMVFGALLALEDQVERWVLDRDKSEQENRPSNAMRFLARAAQKPDEVVSYLLRRMQPYREKSDFPKTITETSKKLQALLEKNGWKTAEPLGPSYLHAFYTYHI